MKFTPETLAVLKNFSSINQSILIEPGSKIAIRAPTKSILAVAEVSEVFKDQLAIFNLPEFLNVFSMFKDPSLDVSNGRQVAIREGKTVVRYTFAEPSLIPKAPTSVVDLLPITSFELKSVELQSLLKAAAVMSLPEVVIEGDGSHIRIGALDSDSSSSNSYNVEVGDTDEVFRAIIKLENFKQLIRDYRVTVTNRLVKFESIDTATTSVTYWLAVQQNSKF